MEGAKRLGEAHYHVTENNCESFVMWCICNSNVSLSATPESIFALKIVPDLSLNEDFYIQFYFLQPFWL